MIPLEYQERWEDTDFSLRLAAGLADKLVEHLRDASGESDWQQVRFLTSALADSAKRLRDSHQEEMNALRAFAGKESGA